MAKCFISRDAFITAVGTVNADIRQSAGGRAVQYATKYRMVAERIASMGRGVGCRVETAITPEGMYRVAVRGFYVTPKGRV